MAMQDAIAQIRAEKGLTQEQMARQLYVTRQAVSRWEAGALGFSREEAVSLMATLLPHLKRWQQG